MNGQLKQTNFKIACLNILKWALSENFSGFDPYDGLNIPIFSLEFIRKKYIMLITTQFFKNFPINLRPFFGIKKERNPKGIALFVLGLLNLYEKYNDKIYLELAENLLNWLKINRSPYSKNYAWGYNFPWQSRNSYKPKNFPNIVSTTFVGLAFLEGYKKTKKDEFLEITNSSCKFIVDELNITIKDDNICFSYSPVDYEKVYNATLLGSLLLMENWHITNVDRFKEYGEKSVRFVLKAQNDDGSWYYGENKNQKWIDNFHTGYNLWCLKKISKIVKIEKLDDSVNLGMKYYIENLFDEDFLPKYFHNKLYPLDIHCFATAIIVFVLFNKKEIYEKILNKSFELFLYEKYYFYYRKNRFFTNKIPYMRWSNAWMFFALSEVIKNEDLD